MSGPPGRPVSPFVGTSWPRCAAPSSDRRRLPCGGVGYLASDARRRASSPSGDMTSPNILIVMTDEERYPPPYETETVRAFRREQLPARESLRAGGVEFHRHYAGSTACLPSRTTLFTGQYPSLHGASQTDGLAKKNTDPAMSWLDPSSVPTLGDWFRAGGYHTHYRGKWHISHADLFIPGTHDGLMASDDDGKVIADAIEAYRKADRLDPFGFSGWIGREPHGAAKSDCGAVRDGVFAEQVVELFAELAAAQRDGPWLAVASFVNPHDISFGPRVGVSSSGSVRRTIRCQRSLRPRHTDSCCLMLSRSQLRLHQRSPWP